MRHLKKFNEDLFQKENESNIKMMNEVRDIFSVMMDETWDMRDMDETSPETPDKDMFVFDEEAIGEAWDEKKYPYSTVLHPMRRNHVDFDPVRVTIVIHAPFDDWQKLISNDDGELTPKFEEALKRFGKRILPMGLTTECQVDHDYDWPMIIIFIEKTS